MRIWTANRQSSNLASSDESSFSLNRKLNHRLRPAWMGELKERDL
jgi:hypothetical protein